MSLAGEEELRRACAAGRVAVPLGEALANCAYEMLRASRRTPDPDRRRLLLARAAAAMERAAALRRRGPA